MIQRPKLNWEWRYYLLDSQSAMLVREEGEIVISGALPVALLPYLDGTHTLTEIVEALNGKFRRDHIYYALLKLQKEGYISDAVLDVQQVPSKVRLRTFGNLSKEAFEELLKTSGMEIGGSEGLLLVLAEDYLLPELSTLNQQALETGEPWLLARPLGKHLLLGPLFIPHETACWECLAYRMRCINPVKDLLASLSGEARPLTPPLENSQPTPVLASALLARQIQLQGAERLKNRILSLDTTTFALEEHTVFHRPQCPVCGDSSLAKANSHFVLQSRKKTQQDDGGHRTATSVETFERYRSHISPFSGTLPLVAPIGEPIEGVYAYVAGPNMALPKQATLAALRSTLRSSSMGKGMTEMQAKVGALCEALERYSFLYQGDSSTHWSRLSDLGEQAIDPRSVLLFSEDQYDRCEETNKSADRFNIVPERFDPAERIEWTPIRSLVSDSQKYLATAQCWFRYGYGEGKHFANACSNGCASGNTLEEAMFQGLMELIERDSVALWWYNRTSAPRVDLNTFNLPSLEQTVESYRVRGRRDLWALDLTSDTGIPVFAAISTNRE